MTQHAPLLCTQTWPHAQPLTACPLNWVQQALIWVPWKKPLQKKLWPKRQQRTPQQKLQQAKLKLSI